MAQMSLRQFQESQKSAEVSSAEAFEVFDAEEMVANRPSAPLGSREYENNDTEHSSRFDDAATNSTSGSDSETKPVETSVNGNDDNSSQRTTSKNEPAVEKVIENKSEIEKNRNETNFIPRTKPVMDIGLISEELDAEQKVSQDDSGDAGTISSNSLSSQKNNYKSRVFDTFQRKRASLVSFVDKVKLHITETCTGFNTFVKNSANKIRDSSVRAVTFLHESSTAAFWSVIYFVMTILFTMCGFLSKLPKYVPEPKYGTPGRQRLDNIVSQLLESRMLEEVHSADKGLHRVDKLGPGSNRENEHLDSHITAASKQVSGEQSKTQIQEDESSVAVVVNRTISFPEPEKVEQNVAHNEDGSKDTNMTSEKETISPGSRGNRNGGRNSSSSSSSSTSTSNSSNDQNQTQETGSPAAVGGNDLGADFSTRNRASDMYGSVDFDNRTGVTAKGKSDDDKVRKVSFEQKNQASEDISSQTTREKKGPSKMRNSFTRKDSYTNYTNDTTGQRATTSEKESPGLFKGGKRTGQKGARGIGAVKDSLSRVIGKFKNEHEATFTSPCAEKRTMIILSDVLVREFKANVAIRKTGPPKIRCERNMSDNQVIRLSATFHFIDERSTKVIMNRSKNDDMSVSNKEYLQFVSNIQKCMMDLLSEAGC